jgi:hypothetical protein
VVSGLRAPFCTATAVRDPLVETGKPWKSPATRLAAPTPTISRLPSTSAPARAANTLAVEMVSVRDTTAMPTAPAMSRGRSCRGTVGKVSGGKPCGIAPTTSTPRPVRSNTRTATIDRITATSTPGTFGIQRWASRISTRHPAPRTAATPTTSPSATPRMNAVASGRRPSASTEKPQSLGSWLTRIVSASPFM